MGLYHKYFKRPFDILSSSMAIVFLSPILLVTALAIKIDDRGPVFFRQNRIGMNGCVFCIWKFRSMSVGTRDLPSAEAAEARITKVGRFIRRTNIDELPQLLNIFKGDMSVVGPRPCLPSQKTLLELRQKNGSSNCRPGLTGLAQLRSYDGMPETEKAYWDGIYFSSISFFKDMAIIFGTFRYLMKKPPVY